MCEITDVAKFIQSHEDGTVEFKGYDPHTGRTIWVSQDKLTADELYAAANELTSTARGLDGSNLGW